MSCYGDGFRIFLYLFTSKVTVLDYDDGFWCYMLIFLKRNQKCIKSDGKIGDDFYVYENRYRMPTVTVFSRHIWPFLY